MTETTEFRLGDRIGDTGPIQMLDPEPPHVSSQTWSERVTAEFERLGGPDMPDTDCSDPAGIPRAIAIDKAKHFADKAMLNEIHSMLRYLCEKTR